MARRTTIDMSDLPEVRRIVEEGRAAREPLVLRVGDEDVAVLTPTAGVTSREPNEGDRFLASFGRWRRSVDAERPKADLRRARG